MKDLELAFHLLLMLIMGIAIGVIVKTDFVPNHRLEVVAQNEGVCTGCGAASIVTIRERSTKNTKH